MDYSHFVDVEANQELDFDQDSVLETGLEFRSQLLSSLVH